MKKLLLATTALAMVAGSVQAQSSVTVYGKVDAGYADVEKTIGGVKTSRNSLSYSNFDSSRIGFSGTEDLGGGLKAAFTIETSIGSNPSAYGYAAASPVSTAGQSIDATSLGSREMNVALSNSSGTTVKIGFGGTALRTTVLAFDAAYGSNMVGNILTNDSRINSRAQAATVSQKIGDFTVGGALTLNDEKQTTTNTKSGSGYIANVGYAKSNFAFAAAYQDQTTKTNAVAQGTSFSLTAAATSCGSGLTDVGDVSTVSAAAGAAQEVRNICAVTALPATNTKIKTTIIGTSYDFGVAKVFGQYGKVETDDSVSVNSVGDGERQGYSIGVQIPLGKFTAFAQMSDGTKTEAVTAGTAAIKRDHTGTTFGGKYDLSKRTFIYASLGETKLKGTSGVTNELKVKQAALGVSHGF